MVSSRDKEGLLLANRENIRMYMSSTKCLLHENIHIKPRLYTQTNVNHVHKIHWDVVED